VVQEVSNLSWGNYNVSTSDLLMLDKVGL
jgi:hypothetical protein